MNNGGSSSKCNLLSMQEENPEDEGDDFERMTDDRASLTNKD
jgi:hypothetical protein